MLVLKVAWMDEGRTLQTSDLTEELLMGTGEGESLFSGEQLLIGGLCVDDLTLKHLWAALIGLMEL